MNLEVIQGLVEIYSVVLTNDKYLVGCESIDQQNPPGHLHFPTPMKLDMKLCLPYGMVYNICTLSRNLRNLD